MNGFGVAIVMVALGLIAVVLIAGINPLSDGVGDVVTSVSWWIAGGMIVGGIGFFVSSSSFRRRGREYPKIATLCAFGIAAPLSLLLGALISSSLSAATTSIPFPQSTYPTFNPELAAAVVVILLLCESLIGGLTWAVVDNRLAAHARLRDGQEQPH